MIKIDHLQKFFSSQEVLRSISINFSKGQSVALVGPNGSGKTTLLKIILGHVHQDRGKVLVKESDTSKGYQYRKFIGYMPQINQYPRNMTVDHLFKMMKNIRKNSEHDYDLYNAFQLVKIKNKRLGTLSGGMTQQVSAALAFLFNPEILILDEPTAALDPHSNEILKGKVKESMSDGKLIINTSHILSDLEEMTNQVVYLMEGSIIFSESLESLKKETQENRLNKILLKKVENGKA